MSRCCVGRSTGRQAGEGDQMKRHHDVAVVVHRRRVCGPRPGKPRVPVLAAAGLWFACAGGDQPPFSERESVQPGPHLSVIRLTDDMAFVPEHVMIGSGDTVVWINDGEMEHTSTDVPGRAGVDEHNVLPEGAEPWNSGLLRAGEAFRHVFATPGEYTYFCFLHEAAGMIARLTVR